MRSEHVAPANLNGSTLRQELESAGITVSPSEDAVRLATPDTLVIDHDGTEAAVDAVIAAHEGGPTTQHVNDATLRQQARDSLTTLRTSIDTLKAITDKTNANIGPADTKAVARETRRVARQVLALTRLLIGALDSADTGTD